jgi:Ni/Co efflux regulator RcnB
MKKLIITLAALTLSAGAFAQATTVVKEAAKATVEKTEQVGDQAKAAVTTGVTKEDAKAKAAEHKKRAHHHAQKMKDATK